MSPVPDGVAEIDMGYEYLRCKWMAEDDRQSRHKRMMARAMMREIERAATRYTQRRRHKRRPR